VGPKPIPILRIGWKTPGKLITQGEEAPISVFPATNQPTMSKPTKPSAREFGGSWEPIKGP